MKVGSSWTHHSAEIFQNDTFEGESAYVSPIERFFLSSSLNITST